MFVCYCTTCAFTEFHTLGSKMSCKRFHNPSNLDIKVYQACHIIIFKL